MNLDQSNPSSYLHSNPIFVAIIPIPNMKQQLTRHIAWPKNMNIHRLWLWLPPLNHKSGAVSGKSSTMTIRLVEDSSGQPLFSGELSGGGPGGRSITSSMVHVPKGCLAVYVGPELRRFVIPMRCLSSPDFRVLMDRVAEEYGFEQEGGLRIPCDEEAFEHILVRCLGKNKKNDKKRRV